MVNCQLTFAFPRSMSRTSLLFLNFCHAAASFLTISISSILLLRHWPVSTFNSISEFSGSDLEYRICENKTGCYEGPFLDWTKTFGLEAKLKRYRILDILLKSLKQNLPPSTKSNRLSIPYSNSPLPTPYQRTKNLPMAILKLNPNALRKNAPLKF